MTFRCSALRFFFGLSLFCLAPAVCDTAYSQEAAAPEAAAAAPAGTTAAPKEAPAQPSMLVWLIHTSGWIGAIILGLSFYLVASVTRNFMELRRPRFLPDDIVDECTRLAESRDFLGIYKQVSGDESFFSLLLSTGISELRNGLAEAREAMERVADAQIIDMERKISMIAVLGTLGPMIGLLGTLKGMISSFSVIAISNEQLRPSEVAGGISEALVLTFEGVGLSIPAIFFFAYFRNRIMGLSSEAAAVADGFLRRVYDGMRSKAPATSEGAAPPPAAS
ncbi:MotA/TolQ/ExbB proton channel family protein [Planctomicrobium sp. SH664]|uniref:MotA/TolQ/ExbB proton channel family protein n=1 Tax=Planctomicrobium sp. SH664 TaxID=3448125 RepID=UPI003F5C9783